MSKELGKLDLYGILDVSPDSTTKELIKGYRKKALKCHPDKNPNNPKAAELFHELSKALEVLTDAAARAAYDQILKARKAAELRHTQLDSKRKKFKEDLEARENAAQDQRTNDLLASRNLEAQIERLRKEGSRLLETEQSRLREELEKEKEARSEKEDTHQSESASPRLKVTWKAKKGDPDNGGYCEELLHKAFDKYGEVTVLVVSSKKAGSAIVEYASGHSAVLAVQNEIGLPSNPLTLSWISGQPSQAPAEAKANEKNTSSSGLTGLTGYSECSFQSQESNRSGSPNQDFESLVFMRMRQAEERKKLTEQMTTTDGDVEKT